MCNLSINADQSANLLGQEKASCMIVLSVSSRFLLSIRIFAFLSFHLSHLASIPISLMTYQILAFCFKCQPKGLDASLEYHTQIYSKYINNVLILPGARLHITILTLISSLLKPYTSFQLLMLLIKSAFCFFCTCESNFLVYICS